MRHSYRITVESDWEGYDQFDYPTRKAALAALNRLVLAGLKVDGGEGRRFTIAQQEGSQR